MVLANEITGYHGNDIRAQSMTTGSQDVTLTEVQMRSNFGLGELSVQIWSTDPTSRSQASHCDLGAGGTDGYPNGIGGGLKTFTTASCTLAADSTYWVVVNAHDEANDRRRNHALGSGSTSSYGWNFGESLVWQNGQWVQSANSPWLRLITDADLETVSPPTQTEPAGPPPPPPCPGQEAAQRALPGRTVIVHCD